MIARHPSMTDRDWHLATVERPFAIKIEGVWRPAKGVYIYPFAPQVKIKCIYQGKEVILDERHFTDLEGCSETEMEYEVINRNIATFPAKPKAPRLQRLRGVTDNQTPIAEIVAAQPMNWIIVNETLTPPVNPLVD